MDIIKEININLQSLQDTSEDKTKVLYQIEKLLGYIEHLARIKNNKYEARLTASLRDICRVHYSNEITKKQLKIFSDTIKTLMRRGDELTRKEVGKIRTELLDCGLTWLPVTEKAEEEIKKAKRTIIHSIIILLISVSISFAVLTPTNEHQVVSSKTSQIFHKFNCRYVSLLTTSNADIFDTYEMAIEAGLRPCKNCEPQPSGIDPCMVNIIPSREATSFFPINGVVIQSEYCGREFEPNDIGVRIIKPIITTLTLQTKTISLPCNKCAKWNALTGEGDVPQEYIIPIYVPDPCDINSTIIIHYDINGSMPIYESNQSKYYHFDKNCECSKSVPVHIVNVRNGLIAGSTGYWNSVEGILEWRITPFEAGDYVAVMNSNVEQTQLLSITVRAKRIPTLKEFTERWLKGNFNLSKYSEWIENKEMWERYLGTVKNLVDKEKIEWIFEDGSWKPVAAGYNFVSIIDADTNITEGKTEDRQTITKEIKIAPYEWRSTEVKVITTELTTFDEYTAYRSKPLNKSIEYLRKPPYTSEDESWAALASLPTPEQISAHYVDIGISPPPEKVSLPQSFDDIMEDANGIKNFEALPEKFRMETSFQIIDEYMGRKNKYKKYLQEKQKWEDEFKIKEDIWVTKMIEEDMEDMEKMHRMEYELIDDYETEIMGIANNIAQCYASTVNELSEEEKVLLLNIRKKLIRGDIRLEPLRWNEVETMMERIDNQEDNNQ